ncbi:family 78 glycoside hydrolase catalytic domain [Paenibacillus sp. GCM10012303]|uniref:family 78 glycoside hydrolase catalytic domain n=1 Tax=Paenibacillus sp. GCM10012303 TaxID=3317340 RepID=UPI00361225DF
MNPLDNSVWMWNGRSRDEVNQYVEFRHEFTLPQQAEQASLYISVDSEYAVWINGTWADAGQYDDFPDHKAYDRLPVGHLLRKGDNVLCVLAYYQGVNSFQYIPGTPGLIYTLETGMETIRSGSGAYCRPSRTYASGRLPMSTAQLGFTFEYDAARGDGWLSPEYRMTDEWKRSGPGRAADEYPAWYARPVRKLDVKERCGSKLITQGVYVRQAAPSDAIVAELMQSDYLSHRLSRSLIGGGGPLTLPSSGGLPIKPEAFQENGGVYLVLDMGREECGFLELELDGEEGAFLDIAYGEHLDDLRVRASVRGKHFATRYRCGKGRQRFTHYMKRWAGRYLQLHISGVKEKFVLYYAGLRSVEYPVEWKGEFRCPDRLHRQIEQVAVRTLHLCMHEHYEDTPWREQALYAMDSRNQALCGYYAFGEYEFPAASNRLFSEGLKEDGYLELTAPARSPFTIPSFSFLWIVQLEEHLLYSGDLEQAQAMLGIVRRMLDQHTARLRDGLLVTPGSSGYWNFYDWERGLNGAAATKPGYGGLEGTRFDAPLNLFFAMALEAAGGMADACGDAAAARGYRETAHKVKAAVHEQFWDATALAYRTYLGGDEGDHYAELTQSLALCARVCPEPAVADLRRRLSCPDNGWVPVSLSYALFKFQALLAEPELYGQIVFDTIADEWGHMLYRGATSFWETKDGADAFGQAGSLCHGWSAIPVYFYYAYILGVRPVEPGFRVFRVEPVRTVFHQASGTIPTPYGDIQVEWKMTPDGLVLHLEHPEGTVRES